jgi:iron complex transport system ATP-binding protein
MDYSWQKKLKDSILMQKEEYTYNSIIEIKNFSIGYRSRKKKITFLQNDLNLNLFRGDLVCLIGPNGCGKSTFIRSMASLQQPLKGDIFMNGISIRTMSAKRRSEFFSVVLTERTAVDGITVAEIVALGRYQSSSWLGTLNKSDREKVVWAIEQVGMQGFEERMYGTLSDGEKQRTFIAKALSSDAPVMLLDEPTSHLDIPNRVEVITLLQRLTREFGHSVILSTHDLDLALQMADEIWLMIPGKGIFAATPEELMHSGNLDEVFGNKILRFNPHSGSFLVTTKNNVSVFIAGKGIKHEITVRALHRLGFSTDGMEGSEIKVTTDDKGWVIESRGKISKFLSLIETCRFLKKINIHFDTWNVA